MLLLTDARLARLAPVATVCESLERERIQFELFDRVRVEPTDESFQEAISLAVAGDFDAFVAVGGGSTIDTAKAANLYATYPAELLTYVNAPIGHARPVPGPLKPLIAIPTTAGTGSETTGVAIFDLLATHAKTGIAHRRLKPTLGIIDPENTRTQPRLVAAACGLDVLCHALESYTAIPFDARPRPVRPEFAPDLSGHEPRERYLVAARPGIGFRISACAAPTQTMTRPAPTCCWPAAMPAWALAMPAFTCATACPIPSAAWFATITRPAIPTIIRLCRMASRWCSRCRPYFASPVRPCPGVISAPPRSWAWMSREPCAEDAGALLAARLVKLMRDLNLPNGLAALGFTKADIPALVKGTLVQHRVTKLSPRPAGEDDLAQLFEESMTLW